MYDRTQLKNLMGLLNDMRELVQATIDEGDNDSRWDAEKREFTTRPVWPYYGGTRTTGELRRRSMDLTRALAELRKP